MPSATRAHGRLETLLGWFLLASLSPTAPAVAFPSTEAASHDEAAVRQVINDYGRAIQEHDLPLFKKLKPNLTKDEEGRLRRAFETVKSQVVNITILDVGIDGSRSVVHLARRDTIAGSLVSSFPQTLALQKGPEGWVIEQIGR